MFGFFSRVTDPICGMKVDKKSKYLAEYQGNTYYFCSENCLNSFKAEPGKYIQKEAASKSCCH